jgi:hypothetical protein
VQDEGRACRARSYPLRVILQEVQFLAQMAHLQNNMQAGEGECNFKRKCL